MRIDKYLWAVRVFKTRSLASEACRSNRVLMDDTSVKPSREPKLNDIIKMRKGAVWFHYRVKGHPVSRVGAKIAPEFVEDVTPEDQRAKLEVIRQSIKENRNKGLGRPTKKDRRDLEEFMD